MTPSQYASLCGAAAAFAVASVSAAQTATLTMTNGNGGGGEFNTTAFTLTNNAAPGVQLTGFSISIGDTQYLFDFLYQSEEQFLGGNGTQSATLLVGDREDNGVGGDLFGYDFTNFGPEVTFRGQWDIDFDNGAFNTDLRQVFFNNGSAPNAVVALSFSDGSSVALEFPDLPVQNSYTLTIPAPGAAAMLGLAALGVARRRSR